MEYTKRPHKTPAVRWFKEWVPHEVLATGKKCYLLKWVTEDMLKSLKEKDAEPEPEKLKPEPTTEVLYLCSYEGCGKSFTEPGALRKHTQIHGERQYVCPVEGCGKKFLDSSKLKRHLVIHTGEKNFVCPHEGCGKAFNLDFNLKAHMRTHSLENYHVCPYPECGRRYTHEHKLRTHIKLHHEKSTSTHMMKRTSTDMMKCTLPADKLHSTSKSSRVAYASPSRPHACPYEGCGKAYIHEYKLNLHFREHPSHNPATAADCGMGQVSDEDAYISKGGSSKNLIRSKPIQKIPPAKISRRQESNLVPADVKTDRNERPSRKMYEEDDSEETEEDLDNAEDHDRRYQDVNGDDEETEEEAEDEE